MADAPIDREKSQGDVPDVASLTADIVNIRRSAMNLQRLGDRFPAVSKNAARVLASLKMIELSLPDPEGR